MSRTLALREGEGFNHVRVEAGLVDDIEEPVRVLAVHGRDVATSSRWDGLRLAWSIAVASVSLR